MENKVFKNGYAIYKHNQNNQKWNDMRILICDDDKLFAGQLKKNKTFCYLSKPLDRPRLFRNLKAALDVYHTTACKVPLETKDGITIFSASSILMAETLERKVIVHTLQQNFQSIHGIRHWAEQLPKNSFFQTPRSYIVNFAHITNFNHSLVYLDNQLTAYLTRRKYTAFITFLLESILLWHYAAAYSIISAFSTGFDAGPYYWRNMILPSVFSKSLPFLVIHVLIYFLKERKESNQNILIHDMKKHLQSILFLNEKEERGTNRHLHP